MPHLHFESGVEKISQTHLGVKTKCILAPSEHRLGAPLPRGTAGGRQPVGTLLGERLPQDPVRIADRVTAHARVGRGGLGLDPTSLGGDRHRDFAGRIGDNRMGQESFGVVFQIAQCLRDSARVISDGARAR